MLPPNCSNLDAQICINTSMFFVLVKQADSFLQGK